MAEGDTEGHFIQAGLGHITRETEEFGTGRLLSADLAEGSGPTQHDEWDTAQGFDVVDRSGQTEEAVGGGEGRLDSGKATRAFNGFKEGGFFAANVSACSITDFNIHRKAGATDRVANIACRAAFNEGSLYALGGGGIFAANIDIDLVGTNG